MFAAYQCFWKDDALPTQKITKSLCSWSNKNWIAYTTGYGNENTALNINTVYILNPDTPWESYPIKTEHKGTIEHLEWDFSGNYLLTVDNFGMGKIWNQDKSLINTWACIEPSSIDFNNSGRVCKIAWLNSQSHRFQPDFEKLGQKDWFHRFTQNKTDMLTSLSKETSVGFVMITHEGLVKLFFLNPNNKHIVYTARLGNLKSHIFSADFVINEAGKLFVAAVTDPCMVELFSVSFKDSLNSVDIVVEVWPCIVPYTAGGPNFQEYAIKAVKCVKKCNVNFASDQVLVLSRSANTSSVKVYEIKKEQVQLHSRFQSQNQQNQQADACSCLETFQLPNTQIEYMAVTDLHFPLANCATITDHSLLPKLVLFDSARSVYLYSLFTLQPLSLPTTIKDLENSQIDSAVFSPTDHALFTVTQKGNPTMFVQSNQGSSKEKNKVTSLVTILQQYLVESSCPWDVMMYLSSYDKHFIDQCLQQFSSDFTESDVNIQNIFYQSFCHFKALFFAIAKDYKGVFESHCMAMLHNVYYHLIATMQSEKEMNLLDKVHSICTASKKEFELQKILSLLDTKDVTFTNLNNVIFRPMIQWITDYMVHLVRLLLSTSHHHHDWKGVLQYFDANVFLMLRKLCIVFFILYQKTSLNIQPIYLTMVNWQEVLVQLFKMVSKLYVVSLGDSSAGDNILNDLPFSSLPMMYIEYPSQDPRGTVLSQTNFAKNSELDYYDIQLSVDDWSLIHETALANPLTMGIHAVNTQKRQIYDGINFSPASLVTNENVKQCCQCGILTIYNRHQTRLVNEIWSSCWIDTCVCGGKWKKIL